jgi:hypothetical protein
MPDKNNKFAFNKDNYRWMLIGLAVLISGFIIMSLDSTQHGQGFLGLTLGPIVIMAGFIIEFYAIFKKPKTGQ